MSIYRATGTKGTASQTILTLVSTAAIRPRLIAFNLSNVGTVSTDAQFEVTVKRFTAAGTTTAVTPAAVDSGDPASTFTAGTNASAEPTYTANTTVEDVGVNPRSTFRWVALEQRDEVIMPATAANGIGFLLVALGGATTVTATATVLQ